MQALVEVAAAHDLWLLSDEIYALLRYDDAEHCSPASLTGGRERTLVVNAFTKSHTLTGWRVGFLAGPRPVIAAAARIQSQLLGNACTISQHAALAACAEPPLAEATARLRALDARRRFLCAELTAVPGFSLTPPRGAFYVFVDARGLCRRLQLTDEQVCERLLDEQLLAIVPGCAFGAPGFVRISYAASMDDLQRAIPRLLAFATAGRS
jgi:aspartate aminotransferase